MANPLEFIGALFGCTTDRLGTGVSNYFDWAHKGFLFGAVAGLILGFILHGTIVGALGTAVIGGLTGGAGFALVGAASGLLFGSGTSAPAPTHKAEAAPQKTKAPEAHTAATPSPGDLPTNTPPAKGQARG